MRGWSVILLILIASIHALPQADASLPEGPYLIRSVVEAAEEGISDLSIAEGPRIAYVATEGGTQRLIIASYAGGSWVKRTLWSVDGTFTALGDPTLRIDPEGTQHIVFSIGEKHGEPLIVYGVSRGEDWRFSQVTAGDTPMLVILDEGPLIVFRRGDDVIEAVPDGGFMPVHITGLKPRGSLDMALGSDSDTAYLLVVHDDRITLYTRWFGTWSSEVLHTGVLEGMGYLPDVKVIGERPVLFYRDPENLQEFNSRIAEKVDGVWEYSEHRGLLIPCGASPEGDLLALKYDQAFNLNLVSLYEDNGSSMGLLDRIYLDLELHIGCDLRICFPTGVGSLIDENGLHVALINVSHTYLLEHLTWSYQRPENLPPKAIISSDTASGKAPLEVNISWEASDEDGRIVSILALIEGRVGRLEQGPLVLNAGQHRIRFFAWDDGLQRAESSITIEVRQSDLFMDIRCTGTEGRAPYRVDLEATPHNADGGLVSCMWQVSSYSGHRITEGTSASYTFEKPGLYTILVTGIDGYGSQATSHVTIIVLKDEDASRDLRPALSAIVLVLLVAALIVLLLGRRRSQQ